MTAAAMQTLHTTAEVAATLHLSQRILCEKAGRGEIRAAKVGRQWLFEPEAVADYLASRANVPPTPARRRRRRAS